MNTLIYQIAAYLNIISLIIGIALALLLIFTKRKNQKANRFLGFILIIVAVWQCWVLATTHGAFRYFDFLDWIPFSSLLAIGPCIYFYTEITTGNATKLKTRDYIHFIPLLLEWLIFFGVRSNEDLEDYQTYTLISARFIVQLLAVISIVMYAYISIKSIRKYTVENDLEAAQNLKWVGRLISIFALLWFLWVPYAFVNGFIFNYYVSDYDFYPLHIVIWLVTLWMTAKVFLRPEIVVIEKSKKKHKSQKKPSKQLVAQADWLNEKMKSDKYYLNPDLTLQSLAAELDLHANMISQTINEGLNKSFSDFVNEYRINAVIEKLSNTDYANITVLGMAYDSGFNSKTTFNRAFKKLTGKTPVAYKEKLSSI
ncbi:helix-turn-helix domain-containing protein [Maribacter sp.]|nr:helix-turn-helix domain-containing protein [Maribacter sp.]